MNVITEVLFCRCGLVMFRDFNNTNTYFCDNGHEHDVSKPDESSEQ